MNDSKTLADKEKVKEEQNAANDTEILDKEIASWKGFEYALREENRILFNKMLSECQGSKEEYVKAADSKGEHYSAESLVMALIFQQQKMISKLIAKLSQYKKR